MSSKHSKKNPVRCEKSAVLDDSGSEVDGFTIVFHLPDGTVQRLDGEPSDYSVFQSETDIAYRDKRRLKHSSAIAHQTETTQTPEELLLRKEEKDLARAASRKILTAFDKGDHARSVVFHVLRGIDYSDSKALSAATNLTLSEITAAKKKIKRRLNLKHKSTQNLQRHISGSRLRSGS